MSSSLSTVLIVVGVIVAILYVLSIAFVIKDAYSRSPRWQVWAVVSFIPFVGFLVYLLMRPQLTTEDRDEQELDVSLKRRQLMQYGDCPHCGYPIEADYVMCPHCHNRLKNLCPTCRHALNPEWAICPYCTTTIHSGGAASARQQGSGRRAAQASTTGTHRRV